MGGFFRCVIYLAAVGLVSFGVGRVLPKGWFRHDRPPFRSYGWERDGAVYKALKVNRWKGLLPDMSRILPRLMAPKSLPKTLTAEGLTLMLQETCIAEAAHWALCLLGLPCLLLWPGWGGGTLAGVYILGNLPFVVIQRCNRPKLARLLERVRGQEERTPPEGGE